MTGLTYTWARVGSVGDTGQAQGRTSRFNTALDITGIDTLFAEVSGSDTVRFYAQQASASPWYLRLTVTETATGLSDSAWVTVIFNAAGTRELVIDPIADADEDAAEANNPTQVSFTVRLVGEAPGGPITFDWRIDRGSSDYQVTVPADFSGDDGVPLSGQTRPSGNATIPASTSFVTVNFYVAHDDIAEPAESYYLNLSNITATDAAGDPVTGIPIPSRVPGLIAASDTPTFTVSGAQSLSEPASGTVSHTYTITRSGAAPAAATTVQWGVQLVSAQAADFMGAIAGTVTFQPADTTQSIELVLVDDDLQEAAEVFRIYTNSRQYDEGAPLEVTIAANDVPTHVFSVAVVCCDYSGTTADGIQISEGNAGVPVTFDVSLSAQPAANVTVEWAIGGDVTVSEDYTVAGTTPASPLTFTPGDWNTAQRITLNLVNDALNEGDEALTVTLSNPTGGAAVSRTAGAVTVTIEDDAADTLAFGITRSGDNTAGELNEGGAQEFTVALTGNATIASGTTVMVPWSVGADSEAGTMDAAAATSATAIPRKPHPPASRLPPRRSPSPPAPPRAR